MIQGSDTYHDQLYEYYIAKHNRKDVIFSTWKDSKSNFPLTVKSNKPSNPGYGNSALQFYGTYRGALYARELGCTHVVKIRSDFIISPIDKFLELIDEDRLSFLAYHNWSGGYLIDYIIGGPVDTIMSIREGETSSTTEFEERQLFNRFKSNGIKKVNYLLHDMKQRSITCQALKWNCDVISTGIKDALYTYPEIIQ